MNEQATNRYQLETVHRADLSPIALFHPPPLQDTCVCGHAIRWHTFIESYFLLVKLVLAHIMGLNVSVFHGVPQKALNFQVLSRTDKFENH